ncbi:F-box associated interaction domain-containing protein [Artemisia annua]|uniref:F-box associated interaction domain-containing protein n=1 Tax=Artemisia annua TaxID=35608 RepID=A0A2U1P0L0_ARTAN|nr:F-box associated interaction domain-containing protein [Artemisia annua]
MAHKDKQISKASFPPEIIREILLKASVKSLLRCKSVCKGWYSLISDHNFIKTHFSLSSTDNSNYAHHRLIYDIYEQRNILSSCPLYDVLFEKSVNIELVLLDNPLQRPQPLPIRIVGSCDGLVCILVEDYNTLFIHNPTTRRSNLLPSPQRCGSMEEYCGFGYDEMTCDYKVVKLYQTRTYWGTMIYSLKAGSWKEIGRFPCLSAFNDGKFLNGALHWAAGDGWTESMDIVSLDLGKETYGEVMQPEHDGKGDKTLALGVLGEWLCLLCNYIESRAVVVWVMVYGAKDSWTKLASISHPNDRNVIPSYMKFHDPLYISNDGKLLLQLGNMLVVYDCINGSYSEIQNFDGIRDACIVVESLISPFSPLGLGDNNGDEN